MNQDLKIRKDRKINQELLNIIEDIEFIIKMNPYRVKNYNNLDVKLIKQKLAVFNHLLRQVK